MVPDAAERDVLICVKVLHASGFQQISPGARITCLVDEREEGLCATQVIDLQPAPPPSGNEMQSTRHGLVRAEGDWQDAVVKSFDRLKGFGFLTRGKGAEDVFVHMEALQIYGFTGLRRGEAMQIRVGRVSTGLIAVGLRAAPHGATTRH